VGKVGCMRKENDPFKEKVDVASFIKKGYAFSILPPGMYSN
jgi:hypothetical protein